MVLSTTKKTSSMSSITNQNQGGGSKKAGFPHTIGRDSWTSVYLQSVATISGNCCNLKKTNTNLRLTYTANQNLPANMRHGIYSMH